MLEQATTRYLGIRDGKHDLGRILDTLLYYSQVHLIIDETLFRQIWRSIGPTTFKRMLNTEGVSSIISNEMIGSMIAVGNRDIVFSPGFMRQIGSPDGRKVDVEDIVGSLFLNITTLPEYRRVTYKEVDRVLSAARKVTIESQLGGKDKARAMLRDLVSDPTTLRIAIATTVPGARVWNPHILANLKVDLRDLGDHGIVLKTNLPDDLEKAIDWGMVLEGVQNFGIDLFLSKESPGDIVTAPKIMQFARERIDESILQAADSKENLDAFVSVFLEGSRSLGDAYTEGALTFDECLDIIDDTRKFRDWLKGVPNDANLLAEYAKAVTKETRLGRLPAKVGKWALFNAAGIGVGAVIAGPPGALIGLGLAAIDTFVIEHLIKGWRPNLFFEHLRRAVPPRKG